ncbi:MAG: hypothetical protein ACKVUS_17775, partial [Saprospiraceae bacterium]
MKPTQPTCLTRQLTARLAIFALLILGFGQTDGFAQTIFNYTTPTDGVGIAAANATATALTRGPAPILQATDCMPNQGFGSHGWPTTAVFDVGAFNTGGWYVEVTITPAAGYDLKVTGFSSKLRRENLTGTDNDGPATVHYGYQLNGAGAWTTVNPGPPQSSTVCASAGTLRSWALGAIAVTNSITFRIYGLQSGGLYTGDLFIRDLLVVGDVCKEVPTITLDPLTTDLLVCQGETLARLGYSAEEADSYSILYNDGSFTDIIDATLLDAPSSISLTIPSNTPLGVYGGNVLEVKNKCGYTQSYPFTLEVLPIPTAAIAVTETSGSMPNDGVLCAGDIATLTASGGGTYLWSQGAATTQAIMTSTAGTYTVTVTSANGCTATASTTIIVNPLPVAAIAVTETSGSTPNDGVLCSGDMATLTASGGISYLWSTGATTAVIMTNTAGIYSVIVTDANGCTDVESTTITVNLLPVAAIAVTETSGHTNNDGEICAGASATLTASGGTSYLWSPGDATTAAITTSTSGIYTVIVTDAEGCTAVASTTIIVNPLPVALIAVTETSGHTNNDGAICAGAPATLTASGGTSYLWSTSATTAAISTSVADTYTVIVTDAAGCTTSTSTTITVNPLPLAEIAVTETSGSTANDGQLCSGDMATLTASGGTSYLWSPGGATTAAITVSTAGTYTVIVTDANGCTDAESTTITVNPLPTAAIVVTETSGIANNDGAICAGASATLTASGGATYLWSTGTTTAAIMTSTAGIYSVIVTDANGCTDVESTTITVNPLPTAVITGATCVHVGAQIQLTGTTNAMMPTVAWFTSGNGHATVDNTGLVEGLTSGTEIIYYMVTDAAGCSNSASYTISVSGPLTLTSTIDGPSTVACGDLVKVCVSVTNFCDITGLIFSVNWDVDEFDFVSIDMPLPPPSSVDCLAEAFPSMAEPGVIDYTWLCGEATTVMPGAILCYTLRAKANVATTASI